MEYFPSAPHASPLTLLLSEKHMVDWFKENVWRGGVEGELANIGSPRRILVKLACVL